MQSTRIRVTEKDSSGRRSNSLTVINPVPGGSQSALFTTESREELEDWVDAFHQHFYDQSESPSPSRSALAWLSASLAQCLFADTLED